MSGRCCWSRSAARSSGAATSRRPSRESGRPVELLVIQEDGGTTATIEAGRAWVDARLGDAANAPTVPVAFSDLVIGTKCGGSDGLSGITINPAVGHAFDLLVDHGATVMFEETCELIGCEDHMAGRAVTPELGAELIAAVREGRRLLPRARPWRASAAATSSTDYRRSRRSRSAPMPRAAPAPIGGLLKPGDRPPRPGLYLMDTVNDGPVRHGFPNINDTQTVTEMVASGCHLIVFTTGAGSVVGQAVAPVIKVVSNCRVFQRLADDIDVNGGTIADGEETIEEVGEHISSEVVDAGERRAEPVRGPRPPGIRPRPTRPMNRSDRPACRSERRSSSGRWKCPGQPGSGTTRRGEQE